MDDDENDIPDVVENAPPEPDTSDDYIVSKTVYDPRIVAAGPIVQTIDNAGRIDETQSDLLGRTIKTIQNFVDGNAAETDTAADVTVAYQYDSSGRMVTLTALNPKGYDNGVEEQKTRYLYLVLLR